MTSPKNPQAEGLPSEDPDFSGLDSERLHTPEPGEKQLTVRAVVVGCLIGGVVAGMNIYLGLRIGWSVGGSLMAAILSFAFFQVFSKHRLSILETNIAQTAGSGAGTMASAAGLLAPIPAMFMLGFHIPIWGLFLWALSIAYLGVMFAVPLRRQYVLVEKLRFPTGVATANTIMAMFAEAGEAVAKARWLLWWAVLAFVFIVAASWWEHFAWVKWFPSIEFPPIEKLGWVFPTIVAWGFGLYIGPMLWGAGLMIGPRIGASLFLGAVTGWAVLGHFAQDQGWATGRVMEYHNNTTGAWGVRGWILWPGVAIMVADALMSLGLSWRTFIHAFKRPSKAVDDGFAPQTDPEAIPNSWWMTGLALASCGTIIVAYFLFDIPIYMSAVAIVLSSVLANVAVRSTGETDINPIGGMGKVTQLVFGGLKGNMAPAAAMSANLMAAGITGAGASQAGDMMQDLKTGYMLGASPRKQFKAQLVGILAGVFFAVPIYYLFDAAYDIGGLGGQWWREAFGLAGMDASAFNPIPKLGAPAAHAWKAMAEVLSKGLDALPEGAGWAALAGLAFGAIVPVFRKLVPKAAPYTPSGLAFGIAFIVQPFYSVTMFAGSLFLVLWMWKSKQHCTRFMFAVACGLIAGEGLGGIVNAITSIVQSL